MKIIVKISKLYADDHFSFWLMNADNDNKALVEEVRKKIVELGKGFRTELITIEI